MANNCKDVIGLIQQENKNSKFCIRMYKGKFEKIKNILSDNFKYLISNFQLIINTNIFNGVLLVFSSILTQNWTTLP